jgi:hypothetical protein
MLSEFFAYPNGSKFPLGQKGSDNFGPILGKGRHVYERVKHCKCMASLYKHMGEVL